MDFSVIELDDSGRELWQDVRSFLDAAVTPERAEQRWGHHDTHDWDYHRALGRKGWYAYDWPAEQGGAGPDPVRRQILGLELWRCGVPGLSRVTTVQIADSLRPWISGDLRDEVMRATAAGEICICQGITEPGCGSDAGAATTRAVRDGDGWLINGQKMFTTNAQNCRYCFLLTRTDADAPKHRGLTVFLVPLDLTGITITPIGTLGDEGTNLVFYDDVFVDDRYRVGSVNDGWRVLNTQLDAEHGMTDGDLITAGFVYADMLRELFETAVAWAFTDDDTGAARPIDDPTVALTLAQVALDVELARVAPEPMRRLLASELLNRNAGRVYDLAGPEAVLVHGEPGAPADGLFERRLREAPATAIYGGTTDIFRNLIAERELGLPHHRNSFTDPATAARA